MRRPLHLVTATPDEPHPLTYVVSRTRFIEPGTAYVIAALVDPVLSQDHPYAETELYGPGEMGRRSDLTEALGRWERGDHDLFRRDREAHDRIEAAYRARVVRSAQRHPSVLSRV